MTSEATGGPRRPGRRLPALAALAVLVVGVAAVAGGLAERAIPDPPPDWPVAVRYEIARGDADPVTADLLARAWDDLVLVEHRERVAHALVRRRDHGVQRSGQHPSDGAGEPFALLADMDQARMLPIRRYDDRVDLPEPLGAEVADRRGEVAEVEASPDDVELATAVAERLDLPEEAVAARRFARAACPERRIEACDDGQRQHILRVELTEVALPLLVREQGPQEDWEVRAQALRHGSAVDASRLDGV